MPYEIKYRSKWDGQEHTHKYSGNQAGAEGWACTLAVDNNYETVVQRYDEQIKAIDARIDKLIVEERFQLQPRKDG